MRLMKLTLMSVMLVFYLCNVSLAFDRIVILAPDAADIFHKLNLDYKVVGITKHIKLFKKAKRVGTHLRPNIEIIKSLNPDLIVVKRKNNINASMFQHAKIYAYNPQTLEGIEKNIRAIGKMFNKEKEAINLITSLNNMLQQVKNIEKKPKVVFEVMETPYIVAGKKSIINDIIEKAGGSNAITSNRYFVRISPEKIVFINPDIYLYEVGPMNKNPANPKKRALFKKLKMLDVQVDQDMFLRSNTVSFKSVLFLNKLFLKWSQNAR